MNIHSELAETLQHDGLW